jgi:type VI secretion system secreted protein Hcp
MAVDMFMKLNGIEGESRDSKHAKEIDVLAWSWGSSNSGSAHVGGGAGAGKVNVQDLSFTKYVDASSHLLLSRCSTGKHIPDGTLTVRKAGGTAVEYIVIKMKEILISSVSSGGSGGEDRLTENVSLNFAEYEYAYTPQKADGSADAAKEFKYSIAENVEK